MREELGRLRRLNMDSEELIARLQSEVSKTQEKIRSLNAEVDSKDQDITNLNDLVMRRKQEVLTVQQDNDRIMGMLRQISDQKDNVDAQKMLTEEKYLVDVDSRRGWTERSSSSSKSETDTKASMRETRSLCSRRTRSSRSRSCRARSPLTGSLEATRTPRPLSTSSPAK